MRFTTAILFAFVAFASNQAFGAYIPADGESVDAHGVHGHRRHWEHLETREMETLQARSCQMTSKPKRNCNINTCRAGGGRCAPAGKSGRCSGTNMWGSNAPFECSTNCKCETF
ncbi:hypothetical protein M408DRAFT_234224 [Serendipita vermifera MAFF 305830]|uniref:Uncharacterized protein n=1 Tax=Serendipita vermifera MAFF 305830 TaxID=933852 RepID=A0A0C2X4M5_SERVB|nr:hypothetical protein M408DRAFT_234224 [Serendipita vermifera MAFF 305830]